MPIRFKLIAPVRSVEKFSVHGHQALRGMKFDRASPHRFLKTITNPSALTIDRGQFLVVNH
jgi:hypothetical protein